jgi:nucleolar protein 16
LDERQKGGVERTEEEVPFAIRARRKATLDDDDEEEEEEEEEEEQQEGEGGATTTTESGSSKLPSGFGRIERDEHGNIVRIVLADEDEEGNDPSSATPAQSTPWGEPLADLLSDSSSSEDVDDGSDKRTRVVEPKTEFAATLEKLATDYAEAARAEKKPRHASAAETDWLRSLVEKYGDDVARMARDRKLNVWQKTEGEIFKAYVLTIFFLGRFAFETDQNLCNGCRLKKAGGIESLRSG